MKHTITLIPGDGIGPEIVAATVRVIEASGADIEWETQILGVQALEKYGTTLPDETIESIRRNKVALERAADDACREGIHVGQCRPPSRP